MPQFGQRAAWKWWTTRSRVLTECAERLLDLSNTLHDPGLLIDATPVLIGKFSAGWQFISRYGTQLVP